MFSKDEILVAKNIGKNFLISSSTLGNLYLALFNRKRKADKIVSVLKNISFSVKRGETVGIMGRNGAGKSTLLSIICGVIPPTSGEVVSNCSISASLNVASGFSPDFTGRQNAHVFCNLHNIPANEVNDVVAKIYDFSELKSYFEMPVRTYSSGMRARLSFACSAFVKADLIIVDETLSVGDAAFKIKCLDQIRKMQMAGQSFLIVSHSPNMISAYCSRVMVLDRGSIVHDGDALEGVRMYKQVTSQQLSQSPVGHQKSEDFFETAKVSFSGNQARLKFSCTYKSGGHYRLSIALKNMEGITISGFSVDDLIEAKDLSRPIAYEFSFSNCLSDGQYFFDGNLYIFANDEKSLVKIYPNFFGFNQAVAQTSEQSKHAGLMNIFTNASRTTT